jgi:hypothetical protein
MPIETILAEALIVAGVLAVAAKVLGHSEASSQTVAIPVPVKEPKNFKK